MKLTRPLHRFIAAAFTPFHRDGSLAPEIVPAHASFLARQQITTVFVTGTTGECHSLTCDEKLRLYDAWADAGHGQGIEVIAHVGGNSIEDAKALARRAQDLELAAIAALPPTYFKPADLASLIEWCAAIAAAAPALPFYYYDIPMFTGVTAPLDRLLAEGPERIPTLAGIKFSNADLILYRKCLDVAGDRFDLPWGIDEAFLGALATGARGAVGATYNYAPRLYTDLLQAFAGAEIDRARKCQSNSVALVDAIAATGFIGTSKALMARLGLPVGDARAPLTNPTAAQVDALLARLSALGFAEWGARA